MKKWNRGGNVATPVTTETMMRVRAPCVAAYAMIEAMTHKVASSKHTNPSQLLGHQKTEVRYICRLTMINDPSG